MPFLGFGNYAKPGPGVSKDEEEKSVWLKFFIVFKRRLSKFVQLNLIFLIPVLLVSALIFGVAIMPGMRYMLVMQGLQINLWNLYVMPLPLILLSPFWGGLMVVTRRLANEEYAFIWSEYWRGVKENWKQFLANGIFVYVMFFLLSFSFIYYSGKVSESFLYYIPYGMIILVSVLLLFSQYYIPVMIVSVNLKMRYIYKNALIFALMGLGRNLLMTLVVGIFVALIGIFMWMHPILILIGFLLLILAMFAFIAYTDAYLMYPLVKQYIIDPFENKDIIKKSPETQPAQADFSYLRDELDSAEDENAPKYVYVNGKLVKLEDGEGEEDEQIFTDRT